METYLVSHCKLRETDLLTGNVIEWRLPEDVDLEGVEFKAMASGSHTLKTDFVYVQIPLITT